MISDDGYLVGDGSWNLRVYVTDLQVEKTLRVKGDLHMGGVMLKLVEGLGTYLFTEKYFISPLQLPIHLLQILATSSLGLKT